MKNSAVTGIIFANFNDDLLKKLTTNRSMASVPFGARYRLIDFPLSNLVNAGVTKVGIVTKENYRSLMDHVGSGIYWDLDRKNGGLYLLPPYITGAKRYRGTVDALNGIRDYIKHSKSEYIVLCNADVLANVDISAAVKKHIKNEADITLVYAKGSLAEVPDETMILSLEDNNRVTEIGLDSKEGEVNFSIGITIIGRDLLLKIIDRAYDEELSSLNCDVIARGVKQFKIYGVLHDEYVAFMNGIDSYHTANMDLLKADVRSQVFNKKRPVFTKTRDDMPTRYGIDAKVTNCVIGDGCVINGTVKNCVLFRGVKVEKGAVVENSILMQETCVGKDAVLDYVIADKNACIGEGMTLKGTTENQFIVNKNQIV
ncbi:MAG: glucose-1-phosphate adenylyltransferase subunit GlgD [Clostridia bacterium]|nr:glucose-1-phosphate adenylyltransferase subunit GlgD [Clostridia bacterium]